MNTEFYPRYSNEHKQIDNTRSGSYSEASSAYSGSDAMQVIYLYCRIHSRKITNVISRIIAI